MVNLSIHNKCNVCCIFCNTQKLLRDRIWKETTTSEIRDQLKGNACADVVNFTGGGEVTLLRELPELILYAKRLGIREVGMETNGVLLSYPDYVSRLKESGLDWCTISLHSHIREISDAICQTDGAFDLTHKGMKNLQEYGIHIESILHTITALNYKHLKEFIVWARKNIEFKTISLSFIRPISEDKKSINLTPRLSDVEPFLHKALEYCTQNSIGISISAGLGIPLCFMQGYEHFSCELQTYCLCGAAEHKKKSYAYEKIKGEQCIKCSFGKCCSGVEQSYAKLYGLNELRPQNRDIDSIKTIMVDV